MGNPCDFRPVHPNWGFVDSGNTNIQAQTTFIEHTVQRGDTLWKIAADFYGSGARWRVLRAANFTNDVASGVYPLKPGMKLSIPVFPIKCSPGQESRAIPAK